MDESARFSPKIVASIRLIKQLKSMKDLAGTSLLCADLCGNLFEMNDEELKAIRTELTGLTFLDNQFFEIRKFVIKIKQSNRSIDIGHVKNCVVTLTLSGCVSQAFAVARLMPKGDHQDFCLGVICRGYYAVGRFLEGAAAFGGISSSKMKLLTATQVAEILAGGGDYKYADALIRFLPLETQNQSYQDLSCLALSQGNEQAAYDFANKIPDFTSRNFSVLKLYTKKHSMLDALLSCCHCVSIVSRAVFCCRK
jgi:hypothetical protein